MSDLTDDEMLSLMWRQLGPEARERILRAMADEIVHPRAAARAHKKRGRRKESDRAEKIARQWLAYVQGFKRPEMITIHSHGAKFIDQLPGELRHTSGARSGERNLSVKHLYRLIPEGQHYIKVREDWHAAIRGHLAREVDAELSFIKLPPQK